VRKYVTKDESGRCRTEALAHPISDSDRERMVIRIPFSEERAESIALAINEATSGTARIVETDNFGGDYPDENFLLQPMSRESAKQIAGEMYPRFWKIVDDDYELRPGFEP